MLKKDKRALLEKAVIHLIDENVLPYYDELKLYFSDSIYNRQVVFNILHSTLRLQLSSNLVNIENQIISIDFNKAEEFHFLPDTNQLAVSIVNQNLLEEIHPEQHVEVLSKPVLPERKDLLISCFIINLDQKILSQKEKFKRYYFSNDIKYAVCFFRKMAYSLIRQDRFSDCFIIEIQNELQRNQFHPHILQFFMTSEYN